MALSASTDYTCQGCNTTLPNGRYRYCSLTCHRNATPKQSVDNGCLIWLGASQSNGYGILRHEGKNVKAHRVSLELKIGRPLQPGEVAMHQCDNPLCVAPGHIHAGTSSENSKDAYNKGRRVSPRVSGLRNGSSKLTVEDVSKILNEEGTLEGVARKYGVGQTTIHSIRHGTHWAVKEMKSWL